MAKIISDADVSSPKSVVATTLDADPGLLVQTGPTLLYGLHFANTTAAIAFVQCFNAAALSGVTLGTTVPNAAFPMPLSATFDLELTKPLNFPLGLVVFATTTAGGNTGAAVNGTIVYA